ncbi:uncharacterized protein ACN427_012454 isoform 2-T2 [Glossina fuscipes fuscipes]
MYLEKEKKEEAICVAVTVENKQDIKIRNTEAKKRIYRKLQSMSTYVHTEILIVLNNKALFYLLLACLSLYCIINTAVGTTSSPVAIWLCKQRRT